MRYRLDGCPEIPVNCIVVLTRIAPRMLDAEENLPMCFKHIKDYLAVLIYPEKEVNVSYIKKTKGNNHKLVSYKSPGRADDTKTIEWNYKQEKGEPKEYAVKIEIYTDHVQ